MKKSPLSHFGLVTTLICISAFASAQETYPTKISNETSEDFETDFINFSEGSIGETTAEEKFGKSGQKGRSIEGNFGRIGSEGKCYEPVENKASCSILNPSLCERRVEKVKLKNGMLVYLISDPGTKQSAAGICVEAGSWHDPKEYPGMAHFLEHMLFMGNKAYPTEFEYMQYITDHGGKVNASTWPDRTIYMFSINNEAFEGALDRFSHFFIDPLFMTSAIQRELHAVDQEHAKNVEHDGWRQYMVFKETGNPLHPNAAFSTGNAKTLGDIPQRALKKWYESHYSAEKMRLTVLSPLPLEELTPLVADIFSQVPIRAVEKRELPDFLSSEKQRAHTIYLKPIKDLKVLSLMWEIPTPFCEFERRPAALAAYILNSEAQNSLSEQLKREKLADGVRASCDMNAKGKMLFNVDVNLTEVGVSQIDTIITRIFQTLAVLKEGATPAYIFDEMKKMATLNYQYQSREEAFEFISAHAHDILDEEFETYPERTHIPGSFDSNFFATFLSELTPENCIYFVQAAPEKTGVLPEKKEKWMGAEYAIKEIPQEKLLAWATVAPHEQISLPTANPFLPSAAQLKLPNEKDESPVIPALIANDRWGKIYYAKDKRYLVPEAFSSVAFKTPLLDGSAKSCVLADLYIKALTEKLSSTLWYAEMGGVNSSFNARNLKITISFHGYPYKTPHIMKEIISSLKEVQPTKERFELYKQAILSAYENNSKELPVRQARETLDSILYNDAPSSSEKLQALRKLSYDEFAGFSKALLKSCYVEGLFYGNLEESDVSSIWHNLKETLHATPYPLKEQHKKQILLLPEKRGPYLIAQTTPRQGNGVVLLLEEGPFTFEKGAAQEILGKALQEAFFDTLRTKQQTGYIAKAWATEEQRQLLQYFAVQSSSHHPNDLIARFELFLEDFLKQLPEVFPQERFEEMRKMHLVNLEMPPENLLAMGQRLATLAFLYDGDFNWVDKEIEAAKQLTYEKTVGFAKEFLSRNNLKRLAILMEGVLPRENDFHYEAVSKEDLCDLGVYISNN